VIRAGSAQRDPALVASRNPPIENRQSVDLQSPIINPSICNLHSAICNIQEAPCALQLPTLGSDATGQALAALLESGARPANDPAVGAGVRFLLRTQLKDGSWFVARRAIPIQPYFDAGCPHGRDQFISAAATNWATQALIRSLIPDR